MRMVPRRSSKPFSQHMKHIYILLSVALLALVSCSQESVPSGSRDGLELSIAPAVSQSAETRSPVFGTYDSATGKYYLPNGTTFGLYICDHHTGSYTDGSNPYHAYAPLFNNIRAVKNNGAWNYNYTDPENNSVFPRLYIFPPDDDNNGVTDKTADIFAYAPYQEAGTPEAVWFSTTVGLDGRYNGGIDVMYAAENGVDNLNIDAADHTNPRIVDGHLEVPLTFKHALALFEFDISLKNGEFNHPGGDGSTGRTANGYSLQSIRLDRKEGGHPLYVSGSMNAMKGGELTGLTDAETVTFSPNLGVGAGNTLTNPAKAYILQVPSQAGETYADGDYTFTFQFSGQTFPSTFTLLREHIRHADGTTYGFQPGYRYTFKFVIDNYVHFEGVTVGEWETVTEPLMQTEI